MTVSQYMKVSYKNTFLNFSEDADEQNDRRSSKAGSPPRARSADGRLHGLIDAEDVPNIQQAQLKQLNTLLIQLSEGGSRSNSPDSSPSRSLASSYDSAFIPPAAAAAPHSSPAARPPLEMGPPPRVPNYAELEGQEHSIPMDFAQHGDNKFIGRYEARSQPRCPPPYANGRAAYKVQPAPCVPCPTGLGPEQEASRRAESHTQPPSACEARLRRSVVSRPSNRDYRHSEVPKNTNLKDAAVASVRERKVMQNTTIMIRNMPNRYCQRELIVELEDLGFAGKFDFLYVPMDKGTMLNVGYAFVNFVGHHWAQKCMSLLQGGHFTRHCKNSRKTIAVTWAHMQGLEANLAHYEKAAVSASKMRQHRPIVMAKISIATDDA